jgi:hypothetical protein
MCVEPKPESRIRIILRGVGGGGDGGSVHRKGRKAGRTHPTERLHVAADGGGNGASCEDDVTIALTAGQEALGGAKGNGQGADDLQFNDLD